MNERQTDTPYRQVASGATVKANNLFRVLVEGKPIVLTRIDGKVYAFGGLCPHALGNLARGDVHAGCIECPEHGWRFDIRSGESVWPDAGRYRLRRYPVQERGGMIEIKIG